MATSNPTAQDPSAQGDLFLFVLWSEARRQEAEILSMISDRFRIVRSFEVSWPKRHFAENLAAFYGWKSWHVWRNKARKCGTGPFLAVIVEDPSPVWVRTSDTSGHELIVDGNVHSLKMQLRSITGRSNVVHSSVTSAETAHQLAALESSAEDGPIPFRRMVYEDDARVRAEKRRIWAGLLADLLVPLACAVAAGAIIWTDISVFGAGIVECSLIEAGGLALSLACGALMAACAVRQRSGCGAHALFAAFFIDMAAREADRILDRTVGVHIFPWAVTVVTVTFAAIVIRYAKTVYSGLRLARMSRRFPLFACGASLMLFASQILASVAIWRTIGVSDAANFAYFMKESVELFGYALMTAWAVPHALAGLMRR